MNVAAITQILTISQYLNVSELRAIEVRLQMRRINLQDEDEKVLKDIEKQLKQAAQ